MSLNTKIEKSDLARDALYEKVNTIAEELDDKKQEVLVSGTNIKTINGEKIIGSGDIEIKSGGSGRNVGDIFYTTRQDSELNGAVECNGATYNIGDFTGAESIGECLATGKINYINFALYEIQITETGYCEFFAYERGETFKVPTLPTVILKGNQAPVVGNGMALGLTDGSMLGGFATGTAVTGATGNQTVYGSPVGTTPSSTTAANKFAYNTSIGVTTDPTRSGIVANLDVIGVEYRAMVQLANSTTDEAVITVTATLQQLQDVNEQIDTKIANKIDTDGSNYSGSGLQTVLEKRFLTSNWYSNSVNGSINLYSGSPNRGASIRLYGPTYINTPGEFCVEAADENGVTCQLIGKPDGTLQWKARDIIYILYSNVDANGNWYRVYSDGWVEQGGTATATGSTTTLTLLRPFADTNYWCMSNMISSDTGNAHTNYMYAAPVSTTTMKFGAYQSGSTVRWYACGFGS